MVALSLSACQNLREFCNLEGLELAQGPRGNRIAKINHAQKVITMAT